MTDQITFSPEVHDARTADKPMVALESTIITHGMPFPQNVDTARQVEQDVRDAGAVPATIAVLDGRLHVGLTDKQLDVLGNAKNAMKISRADLAVATATGRTGATTVAATMICAHLAGIKTFATGGIGGVHRGAAHDFDISADLRELAITPVTVVSAGAKAILDLPKTLEVLETLGVPVISYRSDNLPAFWSRDSGLLSPLRLDSAAEIAACHHKRQALGLRGGQLIANPIPKTDEISARVLAPLIARADQDAKSAGILGKALTPFLLSRILDLTEGRSLQANIALVRNNAGLAAKIAIELARLSA